MNRRECNGRNGKVLDQFGLRERDRAPPKAAMSLFAFQLFCYSRGGQNGSDRDSTLSDEGGNTCAPRRA